MPTPTSSSSTSTSTTSPSSPSSPLSTLIRKLSSKSKSKKSPSKAGHVRNNSAGSSGSTPFASPIRNSRSSPVLSDVKREATTFIIASSKSKDGRISLDENRKPKEEKGTSTGVKPRPMSVGSMIPAPTSPQTRSPKPASPPPSSEARVPPTSPTSPISTTSTLPCSPSHVTVLASSSTPPNTITSPSDTSNTDEAPEVNGDTASVPSPPTSASNSISQAPTPEVQLTPPSSTIPLPQTEDSRPSSPSPTPSLTSVLKRRGSTSTTTSTIRDKNVRFHTLVSSRSSSSTEQVLAKTVVDTDTETDEESTSRTYIYPVRTSFPASSSPQSLWPNTTTSRISHSPSSSTSTSTTLVDYDALPEYELMKERRKQPVWEAILEVIVTLWLAGVLVGIALIVIAWEMARDRKGKGKARERW